MFVFSLVYTHAHACTPCHVWQLIGSCFPTSTVWFARIELRSSSLVAITFSELGHLTYLSGNKKEANFQGKFYSIVFFLNSILKQRTYNDQNIKNNLSKIGCCLLFMILHYCAMCRVTFIFPNDSKEDPRLLLQGEGIHQPFPTCGRSGAGTLLPWTYSLI